MPTQIQTSMPRKSSRAGRQHDQHEVKSSTNVMFQREIPKAGLQDSAGLESWASLTLARVRSIKAPGWPAPSQRNLKKEIAAGILARRKELPGSDISISAFALIARTIAGRLLQGELLESADLQRADAWAQLGDFVQDEISRWRRIGFGERAIKEGFLTLTTKEAAELRGRYGGKIAGNACFFADPFEAAQSTLQKKDSKHLAARTKLEADFEAHRQAYETGLERIPTAAVVSDMLARLRSARGRGNYPAARAIAEPFLRENLARAWADTALAPIRKIDHENIVNSLVARFLSVGAVAELACAPLQTAIGRQVLDDMSALSAAGYKGRRLVNAVLKLSRDDAIDLINSFPPRRVHDLVLRADPLAAARALSLRF